jgi:2-polyprenyl-3-methyl-5-hydroxy-6-metoxy-1,4-benzoquinol methylase
MRDSIFGGIIARECDERKAFLAEDMASWPDISIDGTGAFTNHDIFMQVESKFYETLHSSNPQYGLSRYNIGCLLSSAARCGWLDRVKASKLRILDIGCGKGQFLLDLTTGLRSSAQVSFERVAVVDLVKTSGNVLSQIKPQPEFFQQSVDGQKLPFAGASFDLVTCNHVLEHLFQTEFLVREIRRVCHPDGLAVISVPNCAAWMNRIAFMFGGQPLGSEVGTESIAYGFWPGFLKDRLNQFSPSGHIRDFTPRSLRDLTSACGFKPTGWWAQGGGIFPTLKRNLGIVLKPLPVTTASPNASVHGENRSGFT